MSTGPERKNNHIPAAQKKLDKLMFKRAREVGVDPKHYVNWLVNRMGELCEPMLKNIESTNQIPEGQQAQVQFFDNNSSDTHQLIMTVCRVEPEEVVETEKSPIILN